MKENIIRLPLLLFFILFSSSGFTQLKVGSKMWTEDNLSVTTFSNGEEIIEARSIEEFADFTREGRPTYIRKSPGKRFRYLVDANVYLERYKSKYDCKQIDCGLLYNWYAVIDPRGLAPKGWHVATRDDWNYLAKYYKSRVGTNIFGNQLVKDGFLGGVWWTSDRVPGATSDKAYCRYLDFIPNTGTVLREKQDYRGIGYFVRCVKD